MGPLLPSLLALLSLACGTSEPARSRPVPGPAWGVEVLPDLGFVMINTAGGHVIATRASDGEPRWTFTRPADAAPGAGRCRPQLAPNQLIYVSLADRVVALVGATGEPTFQRRAPAQAVCPAVALDSGILVPAGDDAVTRVVKLAPDGREQWTFEVPEDAGPIVEDLQVAPGTGDLVLRTPTEIIDVHPSGELNWRAPLSRYSGG